MSPSTTDENAFIEELGKKDVASFEEVVSSLAKKAYASLRVSIDDIEAVIKLSFDQRIDLKTVAMVVEEILHNHFDIELPKKERINISIGSQVSFTVPSAEGLPDRVVRMGGKGVDRVLKVVGKKAENGKDGYTDLAFDWQKRSCTINADGSIDWKKLNSIPNILEGELLLKIHDKTEGKPGVSCFGKPIRQLPGRRHQVHWAKKNVCKDELDQETNSFGLRSLTKGAISFSLKVPDDPTTLESIDVNENLLVKGDINYEFGDITSVANLEVQGNVRGNFSLKSDGFIHVSGSVEGKEVDAQKVKADLITNGCHVYAEEDVEVSSFNNAVVNAKDVGIKTSASYTTITARDNVTFKKNSNCLGLQIHAREVYFNNVKIGGQNKIYLGEELFSQARDLDGIIGGMQAKAAVINADAKKSATVLLTRVVKLESFFNLEPPASGKRKMIDVLKKSVVTTIQSAKAFDRRILEYCLELQAKLAALKYYESILRNIDLLIKHIKEYNKIQADKQVLSGNITKRSRELSEIRRLLRDGMFIAFDKVVFLGANSEMTVHCGNAELILSADNLPADTGCVRYNLPEDGDPEEGKLIFDKNIPPKKDNEVKKVPEGYH